MSYARFTDDSDVYVYLDVGGALCCCACVFAGHDMVSVFVKTTDEMLAHLQQHRDAGHQVPQRCLDRLIANRDENDAWMQRKEGGDDRASAH